MIMTEIDLLLAMRESCLRRLQILAADEISARERLRADQMEAFAMNQPRDNMWHGLATIRERIRATRAVIDGIDYALSHPEDEEEEAA